jgi:drug/metabolite transporter (DMT)-like permease
MVNNYVLFLSLFFISTAISITGQYIFLKFPGIGLLKSYGLAMPFAWVDWIFMTKAIDISHKNKLFTPTQDTFLLVITQFVFVLIYNALVFKNKVTRSDIIGFFLILVAFYISYNNVLSKMFGLPHYKKQHTVSPTGEVHSNIYKHRT